MKFVLVGHRGAGKSTLAHHVHEQLGWEWVDLDDAIEQQTASTCAEIIAESEERFRQLEAKVLSDLVSKDADSPQIISVGGGCRAFPSGAFYVWLRRVGWWEVAAAERRQVWPHLSLTEEFAKMRTEREPRWARHAHVVHDIPRGRTIERAARDLATRLRWLSDVPKGWAASRTWAVPGDPEELPRSCVDAKLLGLAGVEIRSDLFESIPDISTPHIASLRGPRADWLSETDAAIIDIDVAFLPHVLESGSLGGLRPRPLILSTHPDGVDAKDVEELVRSARAIESRHPEWSELVAMKYAPHPSSAFEAGAGMAMMRPLRNRGWDVTYLPQGREFAWMRPLLLHQMNATNYLAVGLSEHHAAGGTTNVGAAWDLTDWLGHLTGPEPETFDLLIGGSVDSSQGDLWHRRAALQSGERADYLKVDVQAGHLEETLTLFEGIGIRGISVTSPHKERILECAGVQGPPGLDAANTLLRTEFGWTSTDTDTSGMVGALREIEDSGVRPGKIAVIGGGGVSDAVLRGIEASPGWRLELHVRARDGWPEDAPDVRLIVNAAANFGTRAEGTPPVAEAWLDLHYSRVEAPPGEYRHFIGDAFFEVQAAAQRDFWND